MRNAKGLLSIVAGLVLLFQAGTTAVYADDGANGNVGAQAQAALETSIKNAERLRNAINAGNAAEIALNTTTNAVGTRSATTTFSQSTTTSQTVVGGVQTLPSTSTGDNIPLTALGVVLLSIGVWLLRKPRETSPDS